MGFMGVLGGVGVCIEPGGGWSGHGRLDVGARLKGEAMKGNTETSPVRGAVNQHSSLN